MIYLICSLWRVFKGCHCDQYKLYSASTFHSVNYAVIWISLVIGRELPFLLYFQLYIRFAVHIFRKAGDLSCFGPWYVKATRNATRLHTLLLFPVLVGQPGQEESLCK